MVDQVGWTNPDHALLRLGGRATANGLPGFNHQMRIKDPPCVQVHSGRVHRGLLSQLLAAFHDGALPQTLLSVPQCVEPEECLVDGIQGGGHTDIVPMAKTWKHILTSHQYIKCIRRLVP
jgi:hypothetical protein